jgi:hypothetical protein
MATDLTLEEKAGWLAGAAAADEGKGISLADVEPEDMEEVYDALNVTGLAKIRLRTFIRMLKTQQQQQQQQNGELRFCLRIHCCIQTRSNLVFNLLFE